MLLARTLKCGLPALDLRATRAPCRSLLGSEGSLPWPRLFGFSSFCTLQWRPTAVCRTQDGDLPILLRLRVDAPGDDFCRLTAYKEAAYKDVLLTTCPIPPRASSFCLCRIGTLQLGVPFHERTPPGCGECRFYPCQTRGRRTTPWKRLPISLRGLLPSIIGSCPALLILWNTNVLVATTKPSLIGPTPVACIRIPIR